MLIQVKGADPDTGNLTTGKRTKQFEKENKKAGQSFETSNAYARDTPSDSVPSSRETKLSKINSVVSSPSKRSPQNHLDDSPKDSWFRFSGSRSLRSDSRCERKIRDSATDKQSSRVGNGFVKLRSGIVDLLYARNTG